MLQPRKEKRMYVTMSHWEASEMTDEMIETMQTKFMPMIKSLGAKQCFEVQTSDTTVTIVTVYPDEATKTAASEKIAEIRSQGADTFSASLVKAEEGPIVASM